MRIDNLINLQKGKLPKALSKTWQEGCMPYVDIEAFEKRIADSYTDGEKSWERDKRNVHKHRTV